MDKRSRPDYPKWKTALGYISAVVIFLGLLGYVPLGGEPIVFGFLNSNIVKVPKVAVFMSPIGFSFLTKIIYAVLIAIGLEQYAFLASCGESWGHALMCLAFWKSYRTYRDEK